jgi:antitoxin component of MazEF toxin-antitoxin module
MNDQVTILVQLINEGTIVFRPTTAKQLEEGLFRLLSTSDYDPKNEEWEFLPNSIVTGQLQTRDGQEVLVAVSAA